VIFSLRLSRIQRDDPGSGAHTRRPPSKSQSDVSRHSSSRISTPTTKDKRYVLANRTEVLVYLAAHELRHLWQAARWRDDRKSANLPLYHGSRGKFSEVDTEGFAITMLREWRQRVGVVKPNTLLIIPL
jgi:hypothetical protein